MSIVFRIIILITIVTGLTFCSAKALEDQDEEIGVLIDISKRELYIYRDGDRRETFAITVGQDTHPTPEGEYKIFQIDWNPDWTPPESEWSEDEEYTPPGDPDNPMGRVRILYDPPYSIHGTEETETLGKDVSHGSVRMENEDIIALAKILMEAGGVEKSEEWYEDVIDNPNEMVQIELSEPIPLTNQP